MYPKYYVNARDFVEVGSWRYSEQIAPKHLCKFLGMSEGKVISSRKGERHECSKSLIINEDGTYRIGIEASCRIIEFLECEK